MGKLKGSTEPRLFSAPLRRLTRATSEGFAVIDWATESIGWTPLPWQAWWLKHALELKKGGGYRFKRTLTLVSRQNGKTELLAILILYWLTHGIKLTISSSASLDTARESWLKACEIAEDFPEVFGRVKIRGTNGLWALEVPKFKSRYKIVPTNRRGGRGLSAGRVVVDELREHDSWDAVSAVESTTLAVADSQIHYISNQGDERAVVLHRYRAMGLSGEDPSMFFAEWSAPDDAEIDDPENAWVPANPAMGHTLSEETLRSLLAQPPAIFSVENLCRAVPNLNGAISAPAWNDCYDPATLEAHRSRLATVIEVSPDLRHVSLMVAAALPDGRVRVETVATWDSPDEARKALPEILGRVRPRVLGWIPSGPCAALSTTLKDISKNTPVSNTDVVTACQELAEQVQAGRIAHSGDEMLTGQILGARKLMSGNGWVFSRKDGWADACYATAVAVKLARSFPAPTRLKVITATKAAAREKVPM